LFAELLFHLAQLRLGIGSAFLELIDEPFSLAQMSFQSV
jgi:hypothetical protein